MLNTFPRLLITAAALFLGLSAASQTFPSKPVTLVSPYLAGNVSDVIARAIAEAAGKELGQPMVVEAKPGAEGQIGILDVRNAPADGHRILWSGGGSLMGNSATRRKPPFDPVADFTPITGAVYFSYFLYVPANFPAKTMKEFMAYAKANPGKINFATASMQTRITAADVVKKNGLDVSFVQYKGEGAASTDLLADRIQAMFSSTTQMPLVKEGKLRVLGTTLPARNPQFPDVPTLAESGIAGGEFGAGWLAFFGPAGMPRPALDRLNKALLGALDNPEVQSRIKAAGLVYTPIRSPDAMAKFVKEESDTYRKIAVELHLLQD